MWFYRFPAPVILSVVGKDATRYTHNRLSNDTKNLQIGTSCVAAALTAQGRVQALFTVFRIGEDEYQLVADGGDFDVVKNAFAQFLVADRVAVKDLSGALSLIHVSVASGSPGDLLNQAGCSPISTHEILRGDHPGIDVVLPAENVSPLEEFLAAKQYAALTDDEYTLCRIRGGMPAYPQEINETIILTECGRSDVVMFGKGCYVGQEVIEKIDAVGRLPKEIKRLTSPGRHTVENGSAVLRGVQGVQLGRVVSSAYDAKEDRTWCFAYLKTGQVSAGERLSVGDITVTVVGV